MTRPPSVLFVCLGNICRSPLAEGAMRAAVLRTGLAIEIDSCGTAGYHIGSPPDPRSVETALRDGVDISDLRARQLIREDFTRFSHIFAMDHQNLGNIEALRPHGSTAHVSLLLDMVPGREGEAVKDPYYGDRSDFEAVWEEVLQAANAFVSKIAP